MVFAHSQTTNKHVNEAANDFPGLAAKIVKYRPLSEPNLIAESGGFRPLSSLEKNTVIHRLGGPYWEKPCPRSCEGGTQTKGTVSPNTDRPWPVNITFYFFPTEI